ncbi:outer membrane protein, partial [Crenalkalicoccus roseus]|uniref:outer membrane protein n=1 Tax=Crenalkalicoccus roseus TaxID=1485588 RepID=UPI0013052680
MSLRKALLAATVLALPAAAQAQPVTGLYVGAGAGLNFRHDSNKSGVDIRFEQPGAAVVGAIGWGFGNGLRAEIEGNYRFNEIRSFRSLGVRPTSTGYAQTYGVMGNVLFDLNLGQAPLFGVRFVPYLGAGAGYAWSDITSTRFNVGPFRYRVEDTDGRFAYQGIAGLAFDFSNFLPGLALTTEYRFFGTLDATHRTSVVTPGAPPRGSFKTENYNHSVLLGVRYNFGAPRPAPAPVVAP